VGLGYTPIQSGLLMVPQALAAMSLKMSMPRILARFGYRTVLVSNTAMLGLLIILFASIGAATPVWLVVGQLFLFGFLQSLQFTSMNTLVYADVGAEAAGDASTIASMAQQRPRATAREDARRIIGSGVGSPQTGNNNHDNDSVR
jgi:hypothetical protein